MPALNELMEQVRRYATELGFSPTARFDIRITEIESKTLVLRTTAMPTATKSAPKLQLSGKQKRLLMCLADGPMKGDKLATEAGYENRSTLYSGRGLTELIEAGLVENIDDGYVLTEAGERAMELVARS